MISASDIYWTFPPHLTHVIDDVFRKKFNLTVSFGVEEDNYLAAVLWHTRNLAGREDAEDR